MVIVGIGLVLGLWLSPRDASSQVRRPGEERPELGEFAPEEPREPALELPPVPEAPEEQRDRLASGRRVLVHSFRVVGSSVFRERELIDLLAPYTGRELSIARLLEARDAITRHYIANGYVSSGAVLPDQKVQDGVVEIRVVEGTLARIEIEGTEHFRRSYLERRLERAAGEPLNVHDLERRLHLLQQDPRVRRVAAELQPGEVRGESVLSLGLEEESPYRAWLIGSNDESPSIGSEGGVVRAEHLNLTGNGDTLSVSGGMTDGLDEWDLRYALPLNAADTTLELRFQRSDSEVVESPFDQLDIEGKSVTWGVGLRHPLYRTLREELWIGLTGELRRSETELLGDDFSFSLGPDNGKTKLTVLRFLQEWTSRTRDRVLAVRSTFNFGIDAFNATDESVTGAGVRVPDGTFFSWLGQFQWAQRLPDSWRRSQLIFRTDVQLTNGPLLSLEQFSVGGARTVRGYRKNLLVRDNALVSSVELRIPILRTALGEDILQIAPFADFGHAWNDQETPHMKTISSLGVGLRYRINDRISLEGYWGGRLRSVPRPKTNLQNYGVHLRAVVRAF
jgi:hemolysin activation/secretion protein